MLKKMNKEKVVKGLKEGFKIYSFILIMVGVMSILTPSVLATDGSISTIDSDPITVVNNLSKFIFQLIKVIGGIIVGYAIAQIGLSFTSHDASQRANGFLFFAGGVIIMFAEKILKLISG